MFRDSTRPESLAIELATAAPPDGPVSLMDAGWYRETARLGSRFRFEDNSHQGALRKLDAMLEEVRRMRKASTDMADDFIDLTQRAKSLKDGVKEFACDVRALTDKRDVDRYLRRTTQTLSDYGEGLRLAVYYVDALSCCSVAGRREEGTPIDVAGRRHEDSDPEGDEFFARCSVSDSFIL